MSRPWMPLYVADYLADTLHLSGAEHGAYLLLIMHYWQKGNLPQDDRKLASIARATPEQWSDMRDTIAEFFGDGWTHARIDAELKSARESYERRVSAGRKGGQAKAVGKQCSSNANGNAKAGPKQSQPQSHSPTEKDGSNEPSSPEPGKPAPVAAIGLPTVSDGDYPVSEADVGEWASAFPGVDVRQQLAAMRQWLIANPTRRKTKRGMRKFVVSWLDRRQNAGPATQLPHRANAPPSRRMNAVEANLSLREQDHGPESQRCDSRDAELLPPDKPGLQALVGDVGQALRWPDGSGHH